MGHPSSSPCAHRALHLLLLSALSPLSDPRPAPLAACFKLALLCVIPRKLSYKETLTHAPALLREPYSPSGLWRQWNVLDSQTVCMLPGEALRKRSYVSCSITDSSSWKAEKVRAQEVRELGEITAQHGAPASQEEKAYKPVWPCVRWWTCWGQWQLWGWNLGLTTVARRLQTWGPEVTDEDKGDSGLLLLSGFPYSMVQDTH